MIVQILDGRYTRLAGGSPREARSLVHQHLSDAQLPVFLRTYEQMSRHYLKAGRLHKSRWSIGVILSVGLKNILQNEAKETRKSAAK